jgi:hypothetical protein
MAFRLRRRVSVLSGGFAALLLFVPSRGQAAPTEADRMVAALWDKLLTHCGDSYFYAGSPLDRFGDLTVLLPPKAPVVMEFQKVRFNVVPLKLTPAEQMNGVTFRGRVTMVAGVYRQQGGPWRDGLDATPRNMDETFGQAVNGIAGDAGEMGITGAMAFEIAAGKGAWVIRRSQTHFDSPMVTNSNFLDLQKVLTMNAPKYSCGGGGMAGGMSGGGTGQPLAAGMPAPQARVVQSALSSTRAAPIIQDARKGIAFLPLTPQELAAFTFLHDGRRWASPQSAPYKQVTQAAADRFPTGGNLPDSQYLRPGTAYRPIYYDDLDPRNVRAQMQFERTRDQRYFVLVAVTSGPHAGETVLIDARAMNSDRPIVQANAAR